jgi:hypothetical protein
MELRSGRSLKRSRPPPQHGARCERHDGPGVEADLISALPDEWLLLILARLGSLRAAVQTSLLSRRWRGLWTELTDLAFRRLEPATIEAALARFARSSVVSFYDVQLPHGDAAAAAQAKSLLCSAARLSPETLVFTLPKSFTSYPSKIVLPSFPSTVSIHVVTKNFPMELPAAGEFGALERLFLSGRYIVLGDLLNRCPRLRVISLEVTSERLVIPPPVREFAALQSLTLTGTIDGLGSLLHCCRHLHVLSITCFRSQQLTLPSDVEFPMLKKLSLSGDIVDLTTLLNRCPRLRVLRVTFRNVTLHSLEETLATLEVAGPFNFQLSLLGFEDIYTTHDTKDTCFASVLRTAARLSSQEFLFNTCYPKQLTTEPFPNFHHTTAIQINLGAFITLEPMPGSDFSDLERLSLSCNNVNLATLVPLCARLRELRVTEARGDIKVHSKSLQKLDVSTDKYMHCDNIDILTPALEDLKMVDQGYGDTSVSIFAPTVEKIWWDGFHFGSAARVFPFWSLRRLRLETARDTCSCYLGVLSLHISAASVRSSCIYVLLNPCWSYLLNFNDPYHPYMIY